MNDVRTHLSNGATLDLGQTQSYAAIFGESPSRGARSPTLWNRAFKGFGISGTMLPFDVASSESLGRVIEVLKRDSRFLGGAVAMPYKQSIIPFLDALEPEAQRIGAINCIYRKGSNLVGSNTDGAGALHSVNSALSAQGKYLDGRTVAILGLGGAGRAVAAYLASAVGANGKLQIFNRDVQVLNDVSKRLGGLCAIEAFPLSECAKHLSRSSILINCTRIGFEQVRKTPAGVESLRFYTPLAPVPTINVSDGEGVERRILHESRSAVMDGISRSLQVLEGLRLDLVFDVIYQPAQTPLLMLASWFGFTTLNGLDMNLEQAVIAFSKANFSRPGQENQIRELMAAHAPGRV